MADFEGWDGGGIGLGWGLGREVGAVGFAVGRTGRRPAESAASASNGGAGGMGVAGMGAMAAWVGVCGRRRPDGCLRETEVKRGKAGV